MKNIHLPISPSATGTTPCPCPWQHPSSSGKAVWTLQTALQPKQSIPSLWKRLLEHRSVPGMFGNTCQNTTLVSLLVLLTFKHFPCWLKASAPWNVLKSMPTCLLSNFLCNCCFPHRKCFSLNGEWNDLCHNYYAEAFRGWRKPNLPDHRLHSSSCLIWTSSMLHEGNHISAKAQDPWGSYHFIVTELDMVPQANLQTRSWYLGRHFTFPGFGMTEWTTGIITLNYPLQNFLCL